MDKASTPAFKRLARAMFGAYSHDSDGEAFNGDPLPCWSDVVTRDGWGQKGVPHHWLHLADSVVEATGHKGNQAQAELLAEMMESQHRASAVFNRMIQ